MTVDAIDPSSPADDLDPVGSGPDSNAARPGRPGRRTFVGLAAGAATVALGGGTVATPAPDTRPVPALQVTASTLPPLPIPEPVPENAHADTPQVVLGTIELPRIGVTGDIQEGITLTAINRGPGHWPGTAMPGELGNVVIAGHRTTYTKPFNRLDALQPGDPIVMTTPAGRFTYQVRGIVIVPGEAIDIAEQSYAHTATLFACHPPGSARQRIVAKLRLLAADGTPVDPDEALPPLDAGSQATDHTLNVRVHDPLAETAGSSPVNDPNLSRQRIERRRWRDRNDRSERSQ
jgi:LPXTG-site transpeptidase (sortase) family protein